MNAKRFLVFQHLTIEHPGIFRDFFKEDGFELFTIELDEGELIPDLTDFDALWVMGGPMDVWQEDEYPWLVEEKRAIRKAVNDLNMPYVGICLGHQLLADALGAEVGPGEKPEVGVMSVKKTEYGRQNPFLSNLDDTMISLQWHSAEIKAAPEGFQILAESDRCAIQSLALDARVFTTQYHQEIIDTTVSEWSEIPEYKTALEEALGDNAVQKLEKESLKYMADFNKMARQFYENWKSVVFNG
jgi:GMP synthase-like glutamine amidotransferase